MAHIRRTPSKRPALNSYGSFDMSRPASPLLDDARRIGYWSQASESLRHSPSTGLLADFGVRPARTVDPTMEASFELADDDGSVDPKTSVPLPRASSGSLKPRGVQKMEAVNAGLKKTGHLLLYAGIYLITLFQSLEANGEPVIEPFFLSGFNAHSMLSSVVILTNLAFGLGRPPMAKSESTHVPFSAGITSNPVLDHFGRAEAVAVSTALYGIGYVAISLTHNIVTFSMAKTIAAFGSSGLQLCITVLIADTTKLSNRALVSSTIAIPWLITIWLGPLLASGALDWGERGQRHFYLIFGVLLPLLCIPLISTLHRIFNRVSHSVLRPVSRAELSIDHVDDSMQYMKEVLQQHQDHEAVKTFSSRASQAWQQIDLPGIGLLTLSGGLILLPFSLAATRPTAWHNPVIYLSIALGIVCAYLFHRHERTAAFPFISGRLLRKKTVRAGCCLGMFHFICQFTYESYFTSWLQVARFNTARDAQYINQAYLFSACLASLFGGLASKWSGRYRIWGLTGVLAHIVGALMMVRFRRIENPTWEIIASQVIGGVGGGLTTMAQLGIQAVVSHHDLAMVTAIYLTVTQCGAAIGGSLAGAVWTTMLPAKLTHYLPPSEHDRVHEIMGSIVVALSYPPNSLERIAINKAYSDVQWLLQVLALVALVPAFCGMYMMEDVALTSDAPEAVVVLGRASVLFETEDDESEASSLLAAGPVAGPSRC